MSHRFTKSVTDATVDVPRLRLQDLYSFVDPASKRVFDRGVVDTSSAVLRFSTKNHDSWWLAHRMELEDRRHSSGSLSGRHFEAIVGNLKLLFWWACISALNYPRRDSRVDLDMSCDPRLPFSS